MKQGFALTELDQKDKQIVMTFDAPGGAQTVSYDAVILALPFTKLRQVKGLEGLKLGAEKLKCIRELGMGHECQDFARAPPRACGEVPNSGLPAPSNGTFYSDLGFQNLWESSRAQPGEAGIITNYLGVKPGLTDAKSALDAFRADLPKMSQKMADSLDPNAVTSWFWAVYPFTLGSYASAKVGQYTTLLEVAAEPALQRPPAICRRAYQRRLSRLYEWRRAERKPCLRGAYQDHGAAQISVQLGVQPPLVQVRDGCFPVALGPVLD